MNRNYQRHQQILLKQRLAEPVNFIQILSGPRQVGKTTIIRSLIPEGLESGYYISVDDQVEEVEFSFNSTAKLSPPKKRDEDWLKYYWQEARERAKGWSTTSQSETSEKPFVFAIDEIQKIEQWSEIVKGLWDADRAAGLNMHVVLLGSAPLLMQKGLSESLAGRFEILPVTHWSYKEMREVFDLSLEEYIYFGGYPGAAKLIHDESRWRDYVRRSLIQPNIEKDILKMVRIQKPMLFKQLFELGCHYSGYEMSFRKMVEALASNNDQSHNATMADYLHLLTQAKLLAGLQKYTGQEIRKRNSSPKFHVFNTALMSAIQDYTFTEAKADRTYWGRLVESAVGAHLLNTSDIDTHILYWRESDDGHSNEVDFIIKRRDKIVAIEVKSGNKKRGFDQGLKIFSQKFSSTKIYLVGDGGISLADFLSYPVEHWLV